MTGKKYKDEIKILIASPSDVVKESEFALDVIRKWNTVNSATTKT